MRPFVTFCHSGAVRREARGQTRHAAHLGVATESVDFALEPPEVERLTADCRDGDAAAALLAMEDVQLLEEVEARAGGRLHRV